MLLRGKRGVNFRTTGQYEISELRDFQYCTKMSTFTGRCIFPSG